MSEMVGTVEELSIERLEEGRLVTKQLKKEVLNKGAWVTVLYQCQDLDPKTEEYHAPAAKLVRYRKVRGRYMPQSKFNISSAKQALAIAGLLQDWFSGSGADAANESDSDSE